MTRVALYARYSDDKQNPASIEDQFLICREQAAREGWRVVSTYGDAAVSGASVILRPGIQSLLEDAQAGKFDVVMAEALDRISRDQADVATIFKHIQFAGVSIITLAEGEISELHVGLKGTMNALFLKDLSKKTRRGLRGRVEKGKSGGGRCYGYDVVKRFNSEGEPVHGERAINEIEATVVRRIYRAFANGQSPRGIAKDLNRDAIPGPFGGQWSDTTIRGHVARGNGILNNELYVGVLLWNRQRFIKHPTTGKRVSRMNPESEWVRTEVPDLRIIDENLWQAVRGRHSQISEKFENVTKGVREARDKRMNELRRPVYLLSGLLECGCCGGRYSIIVKDRYGCASHFRKGNCANSRTIRRDDIERRALSGLRDRLVSTEAVREAVAAYVEYTNRQNRERRQRVDVDRRELNKVERGIVGIMAAIEDGMYQPTMKARLGDLERQKSVLLARLAEIPTDVPDIHPNIAQVYKRKVEKFIQTLDDPGLRAEVADSIRSLVGKIVLTPGEKRGQTEATLSGELMGILNFVEDDSPPGGARLYQRRMCAPATNPRSKQQRATLHETHVSAAKPQTSTTI